MLPPHVHLRAAKKLRKAAKEAKSAEAKSELTKRAEAAQTLAKMALHRQNKQKMAVSKKKLGPQDRKQAYQDALSNCMIKLLQQSHDWQSEATQIAQRWMEDGLLMSSPQLTTPHQFAQDVIEDNPVIWENSNLDRLYETRFPLECVATAQELATMLLIPEPMF